MEKISWDQKVPKEAAIEAAGIKSLKPFLDKYYAPYRLIPQDTVLQGKGKIDCISTKLNGALEFKIVTGEYDAIFAEFKGQPDDRPEYKGWAAQAPTNTKTHLIYLMTKTIYIIDMNKFKKWYQTTDTSSYFVSRIRDDRGVLKQWMYGHLVPVKDFEIIAKYDFGDLLKKCIV